MVADFLVVVDFGDGGDFLVVVDFLATGKIILVVADFLVVEWEMEERGAGFRPDHEKTRFL